MGDLTKGHNFIRDDLLGGSDFLPIIVSASLLIREHSVRSSFSRILFVMPLPTTPCIKPIPISETGLDIAFGVVSGMASGNLLKNCKDIRNGIKTAIEIGGNVLDPIINGMAGASVPPDATVATDNTPMTARVPIRWFRN